MGCDAVCCLEDVQIFSSLHVSGEQLKQITGIAAILRFPMPELLELDDSNAEDDEDDFSSSDSDGGDGENDEQKFEI